MTSFSYIARTKTDSERHKAGTVVAAAVDRPEYKKDNAKTLGVWIKDNLTVERVPLEWVRENFGTQNVYQP